MILLQLKAWNLESLWSKPQKIQFFCKKPSLVFSWRVFLWGPMTDIAINPRKPILFGEVVVVLPPRRGQDWYFTYLKQTNLWIDCFGALFSARLSCKYCPPDKSKAGNECTGAKHRICGRSPCQQCELSCFLQVIYDSATGSVICYACATVLEDLA